MSAVKRRLFLGSARVAKDWRTLTPSDQAEVKAFLATHPKGDPTRPKLYDHIEGKIREVARHCNHEYKGLSRGRRVFYRLEDGDLAVVVTYVGPHL